MTGLHGGRWSQKNGSSFSRPLYESVYLAAIRADGISEPAFSKQQQLRQTVRLPIEAHKQFDLVMSLASAVAEGHPFEDILTADVLVDILTASASFEVFSALVPRNMHVVFVNPDLDDQDAVLLEEHYKSCAVALVLVLATLCWNVFPSAHCSRHSRFPNYRQENDIFVSSTSAFNIVTVDHMTKMKNSTIAGNIGLFHVSGLSLLPKRISEERIRRDLVSAEAGRDTRCTHARRHAAHVPQPPRLCL